MNDEDSMKTSACLMVMNGLSPRDIAQALNVSELQVRQWLRQDTDNTPERGPREKK